MVLWTLMSEIASGKGENGQFCKRTRNTKSKISEKNRLLGIEVRKNSFRNSYQCAFKIERFHLDYVTLPVPEGAVYADHKDRTSSGFYINSQKSIENYP